MRIEFPSAKFLIMGMAPLHNDPAFNTANRIALVISIDAEIATWAAADGNAVVADIYSNFIDNTPNPGDVDETKFKTNEVHPNAQGSNEIGVIMGALL